MSSTGWSGDSRGQDERSRQPGEAPPGAAPLPREAINFAIERQRHAGFVGRTALLARLDQQLINGTSQRWAVVTGGLGMGKSALVMNMTRAGAALCVPGNHETKLLRKLQGREVKVSHGLEEMLAQLAREPAELSQQVANFIDGLVSHYVSTTASSSSRTQA